MQAVSDLESDTPTDRWRHWAHRWLSVGGLLCAIGVGNLIAALNWNAILKGMAGSEGSSFVHASAASDRYAIWGFALLIIGQQMVTRRALVQPGR